MGNLEKEVGSRDRLIDREMGYIEEKVDSSERWVT